MKNEFWIVSTLLSVGMIGGILYNWPTTDSVALPDQTQPSPLDQPWPTGLPPSIDGGLSPRDEQDLDRLIVRADDLLLVGNHEKALELFQAAYRYRKDNPGLAIRIALCCESLRRFRHSEFFYKRSIAATGRADRLQPRQRENLTFAAMLGIARGLAETKKQAAALELLCQLQLTGADDPRVDVLLRQQLGLLLAKLRRIEAMEYFSAVTNPLARPVFDDCPENWAVVLDAIAERPRTVAAELDVPEPEQVADESTSDTESEIQDDIADNAENPELVELPNNEPIEIIQRPSDDVQLMFVRGFTGSTPVSQMLTQIAAASELQIELSAELKQSLTGRTARLRSTAFPLPILLDCLLNPVGIVWTQTEKQIVLSRAIDLPREQLAVLQAEQAIRMARQVMINYPIGRCQNSMRICVAGLHLALAQLDEAATELNQLAEQKPGGEVKAILKLLTGMIEQRTERYETATSAFLTAVDQSSDPRVRAIAYANIARIDLYNAAVDPAIVAASRSLALSDDLEIRRHSALNLARAYLLIGNMLSANETLFTHQQAFGSGIERVLAEVYGAYARSVATISPVLKKKAVKTLVIALTPVRDLQLPTTVDRILVARAYKRIGLVDEAVKALAPPTASTENPVWKRRREFELASILADDGRGEEAMPIFRQIADAEVSQADVISQRALLGLALIELQDNRNPAGCLDWCRQLLQLELGTDTKVKTLKLMGQAYQQLGEDNLAAFCFFGIVPDAQQPAANSEN